MTKPSSRRRLAAASRTPTLALVVLAAHLVLSPVLFWRGAYEPFESVKAALLLLTAILAAALTLSSVRLPRDWAGRGVLLFVCVTALTVFTSISWRTSLWGADESHFGFTTIAALAVLFFAVRAVCANLQHAKRLFDVLPFAAAVAGGYALLQWAGCDPFAWENTSQLGRFGRPFGTLGHPNILAAYLAMAVPLTLNRVWDGIANRRRWVAVGFGVIALIEFAAIFAAMSRAAWLALAVAVAVWIVGLRVIRWRHLLVGLGAVGLAVVLAAVLVEPFGERLRHLFDPSGRLFIWKAAWAIFRERPLLGCGPDTFQFAFTPHRTREFWAVEWGATPNRAHNDVLHLLATQGLCGLIAAGVFVFGLVRSARESWRTSDDSRRTIVVAAVAGLAAFAVQAMFGFATIGTAVLAVALAAILGECRGVSPTCAPRDRAARTSGLRPDARLLRVSVGVIAVALIGWLILPPLAASFFCRDGLEQLDANPDAAMASLDAATAWESQNDVWWAKRGEAALHLGRYPAARESLETAVRLVPVNAFHWHNLAQVRAARDATPQAAFAAFDESLRLDPNDPYFSLNAARFALQVRDAVLARRYLEDGLKGYPDFAPLVAERAFLALFEDRPHEALEWFDRALTGDWHGDAESQQRVIEVKEIVKSRLRPGAPAKPQAASR